MLLVQGAEIIIEGTRLAASQLMMTPTGHAYAALLLAALVTVFATAMIASDGT